MAEIRIELGENAESLFSYFHSIPPYDPFMQEHFWTMILAYRVDPTQKNQELGLEDLVSAQPPFCFYCERQYDQLLGRRKCDGRKYMEKI